MSPFFGLQPEDKDRITLEPIFLLMYYGGFLYEEAYNLPVSYRTWFIDRIGKELKKGDKGEAQSRALHDNNPEIRAMQNKARTHTPSRLRRFS